MPRKPRKGEITCTCNAYEFPHRMFGGDCTGQVWVVEFWERSWGWKPPCRLCSQRDDTGRCEVYDGRADARYCVALQEHIEQ